jgi:hypothetical protein
MTCGTEERVIDSLFTEGAVVVLSKKSHDTAAFNTSRVFGTLQPHWNAAECAGIF